MKKAAQLGFGAIYTSDEYGGTGIIFIFALANKCTTSALIGARK